MVCEEVFSCPCCPPDLIRCYFCFQEAYSSKDLKGLMVQHKMESFKEGETVILTLQDKGEFGLIFIYFLIYLYLFNEDVC